MTTIPALRRIAFCHFPVVFAVVVVPELFAADAKKTEAKVREIAGSAEFLRGVPKRFATLKAVDVARHRVTLLVQGETLAKVWALTPDAEVKVAGWWGRLDQFTLGDRVWAWFKTNRADQPVAIFMLADELSEQDMHGPALTIKAVAGGEITVQPTRGKPRVVKTTKRTFSVLTAKEAPQKGKKGDPDLTYVASVKGLKAGQKTYLQCAGKQARYFITPAAFEIVRKKQKVALRKRWLKDGLPGTVTFLHLSGEMDFMLDHEAMRWGRSLKAGDKVSLLASPPIPALVKDVRPWRERTQLRLVMKGADQADLVVGQRLGLRMKAPPQEVETSDLPPDLGRRKTKKERVEWFLASVYCPCGVTGDGCTGDFYTLASCNPNACGMPNFMRKKVAAKIDKGLSDKQIFEELVKEYGRNLVRPHLRP
jgi:hypothetical protein